jgi:hypothetical protein
MFQDLSLPLPPHLLIRGAVAAVWLYEGVFCKLLGRGPGQLEVVEAVPLFGPRRARHFLFLLGIVETALGIWVLSGWAAGLCVLAQTMLLVGMNTGGILWARDRIHDPAGMLVKNFCILVLAWTGAALNGLPV